MKKRLKETTNRSEYNKLRKRYLESIGEIGCSYCKYHKGENKTNKWYGGFNSIDNVRHPSWKLVSKNRKQWMKKHIKIELISERYFAVFEVKF